MVLTGKKRNGYLIKWENIRKVKAVDLTADFLSVDETLKKTQLILVTKIAIRIENVR